jgi:hypothetical protein
MEVTFERVPIRTDGFLLTQTWRRFWTALMLTSRRRNPCTSIAGVVVVEREPWWGVIFKDTGCVAVTQ